MKDLPTLAPEVADCAAAAGFEITAVDQTEDGRVVFTTGLGETRILVGIDPDGLAVVTESDRLGPEYVVLAAPAVRTVEKYLLATFGATIRFRRKLPRIRIPVDREHVAAGFHFASRPFRGEERLALIAADDEPIAWSRSDPIIATVVLVELSYQMTGSSEEIAASYLNSSGSPLFDRFVQK